MGHEVKNYSDLVKEGLPAYIIVNNGKSITLYSGDDEHEEHQTIAAEHNLFGKISGAGAYSYNEKRHFWTVNGIGSTSMSNNSSPVYVHDATEVREFIRGLPGFPEGEQVRD